ncbi:hypothetical protein PCASD_14739 [Puccinia coronata f. sp. avenae]|uniref:Uncharacterized protein n=1 Tax=Puccinia coronata f. sp. avenae TaxID=200324 RepID=A0A2N5TD45_9BASI|nr:hypothetical protein PCASD_14739 [Puccinia coronata f. sp. avenae]
MTEECTLAFKKIKKAVRDSNIWQAAWQMRKFLRQYTLTRHELKWLNNNLMDWVKQLENAVNNLQLVALRHAQEDFWQWLEDGNPFLAVERASYKKHYNNPEIAHLQQSISSYCRAAGYIKGIIKMNSSCGVELSMVEKRNEGIELEAMGACPGVEASKTLIAEDVDWEFIEKHDTWEPLTQWTIVPYVAGGHEEAGVGSGKDDGH